MKALEEIRVTRNYLDYLQEHIINVHKAWQIVQEKCKDLSIVYDDFKYNSLDEEVRSHDLSKLSKEEFFAYRRKFFPTDIEVQQDEQELKEIEKDFDKAWRHHYENNDHHWEKWKTSSYSHPYAHEIHCAHMVIDWMAMGMKFGDTREYYDKNKDKIDLPEWADKFVNEIFDRVYGKEKSC